MVKGKVLVTGASGFIGRQAVSALIGLGFDVVPVIHADCDLLEPGQAVRIIEAEKPTHLLHVAWYAEHGKFWDSPLNIKWAAATATIAEAFGDVGGRRFVGVGSCSEYDWGTMDGICREESPSFHPSTLYGRCKRQARECVAATARVAGFSHAWGRVFHLYGPHEHPARLVPSVIIALLEGRDAKVSHGNQIRDFMHVEDVGRALAAIVDSNIEGACNLGSGEACAVKDVALHIARSLDSMDRLRLGAVRPAPVDPPILLPDIRRLTSLGFSCRYSLPRGLEEAIAWWRKRLGRVR